MKTLHDDKNGLIVSSLKSQSVKRQLVNIISYVTIRFSPKQKIMNSINSHRIFVGLYFLLLILPVCAYVMECFSEKKQIEQDVMAIFKTSLLDKMQEQSRKLNETVGPIHMKIDVRHKGNIVQIYSKEGTETHTINPINDKWNITTSLHERSIHSYSLETCPFALSSLLKEWNKNIEKHGLKAKTALIYRKEQKIKACSGNHSLLTRNNSLVSYNVGVNNEHEFVAYVSVPIISIMLTPHRSWILFGILLVIPILSIKSMHEFPIKNYKKKNDMMENVESRKYNWGNYVYDALNRRIWNTETSAVSQLTAIEGRVLEALFGADGYSLPTEEMKKQVWGTEFVTSEALRSVVCRLRKELRNTNMRIKCTKGTYELIVEKNEDQKD